MEVPCGYSRRREWKLFIKFGILPVFPVADIPGCIFKAVAMQKLRPECLEMYGGN